MIQINKPMPRCCRECFALDDCGDYPRCIITGTSKGYNFSLDTRMHDCPLSPVPLKKSEILRGLKIERECVSRDCNRDCANCDIVQEKDWLLSVYDNAIKILEEVCSD